MPKILINMAAGHIAMKYGFQGPNHTATTACTTGAHSVGDAGRFIAQNTLSLVLAALGHSLLGPAMAGALGLPVETAREMALQQLLGTIQELADATQRVPVDV